MSSPYKTFLLSTAASIALLAPSWSAWAGSAPSRDWDVCPAIVEIDTRQDVFAIGDVHADYNRLLNLLLAADLIAAKPQAPKYAQWTGGKAVLVVTGDMLNKWHHSVDVLLLLRALRKRAEEEGGRVVVSAGNHETEFLADPHVKKAADFRHELEQHGIEPEEVADGTDWLGLGTYLLCLPFGSRVNGWFFSHAGSTGGRTLDELADDIREGVETDGYATEVLVGDEGLLEARMKPRPWWEREDDEPEESVERLRGYARALGVGHIVFGHQPGTYEFNDGTTRRRGTMFQNFDGLVFLIDVGMSRGVGDSKGSILRIRHDGEEESATAIYPGARARRLWSGGGGGEGTARLFFFRSMPGLVAQP